MDHFEEGKHTPSFNTWHNPIWGALQVTQQGATKPLPMTNTLQICTCNHICTMFFKLQQTFCLQCVKYSWIKWWSQNYSQYQQESYLRLLKGTGTGPTHKPSMSIFVFFSSRPISVSCVVSLWVSDFEFLLCNMHKTTCNTHTTQCSWQPTDFCVPLLCHMHCSSKKLMEKNTGGDGGGVSGVGLRR